MIKGKLSIILGKFYELLENEIKVLKTCDNPYIIKLYTLKKTPHNYYLMLEYCNGGDMLAKVRK
jgi:serine/threonine-protein kinase ULK2